MIQTKPITWEQLSETQKEWCLHLKVYGKEWLPHMNIERALSRRGLIERVSNFRCQLTSVGRSVTPDPSAEWLGQQLLQQQRALEDAEQSIRSATNRRDEAARKLVCLKILSN